MAFDPSEWEIVEDGASSAPAAATRGGFDPSEWEVVDDTQPSLSDLVGTDPNSLQGRGRQFLGGVTKLIPFGLGDELAAGTSAAVSGTKNLLGFDAPSFTEAYDRDVEQVRNYKRAFEQEHPVLSPVSTGIGYFTAPLPKVDAATKLGTIAQLAKQGAVAGGGQGFGEGEGIDDRLGRAGTGAAIGSVFAPVAVGAVKAVPKIASVFSQGAEDVAQKYAGDVLQYKPKQFEKSAEKGFKRFLGGAGEPVASAADAEGFTTPLRERVQRITQSPIWERLGNNPKQNYLAVAAENEALNTAKNAVVSHVDDQLNAMGQQSGARPRISPDWSLAEEFVQSGGNVAGKEAALSRELDGLKKSWESGGKSFKDLIDFKRKLTSPQVFKDPAPSDALSIALREKVLIGVKNAGERVADAFTEPGTFKAINRQISDLEKVAGQIAGAAEAAPMGGALGRAVQPLGSVKGFIKAGTRFAGGSAAGGPGLGALWALEPSVSAALPKTLSNVAARTGRGLMGLSRGAEFVEPAASRALLGALAAGSSASSSDDQDRTGRTLSEAPQLSSAKPSRPSSVFEPTNGRAPDKAPSRSETIMPRLLDAVRQVESSGGKNTTGPKTPYGIAKGPYQLLDATGREYHRKLGIRAEYDPYDEKQSRRIAEAYLSDLIGRYNGDVRKALTAFHTGMGNLARGKVGAEGRVYAPKVEQVFAKLTQQAA